MPHIEVLPNSSTVPTPGYALVPDTRGLPQIPTQPVTSRKRAARNTGYVGGDTTVRQQNAVLKHLAELDKDSHRDVQISIPSKQKDNTARGSFGRNPTFIFVAYKYIAPTKKMTPNVRRILMSQKTFANHLADEEAALAQQAQNAPSSAAAGHQRSLTTSKEKIAPSEDRDADNDAYANNPLLRSYVPQAPTAEVMEALVDAPPLSYNAARATLPEPSKPRRYFCEICGYWGTIKCVKCGARVCGLECKGTHDDGRCQLYA